MTHSIATQPGLLELLLALKPRKEGGKDEVIRRSSHIVDSDSCLRPVLDMIDPDQQVWVSDPCL